MSIRWRPKNEGIGPFSKLNLQLAILSTEIAVKALGEGRMPLYPWSKNYIQRRNLNSENRLPDYNMDPPDELLEDIEDCREIQEPENYDETCQMLGLHS